MKLFWSLLLTACTSAPAPSPPTAPPPPPAPLACAASASCADGQHCSTEDGVCDPPPDCKPGEICAQVCYGQCVAGAVKPVGCQNDADCRLFSDYCTGCDCRALAPGQAEPKCEGPGVRCLVDPCQLRTARCEAGQCVAVQTAPQ